MEVALVDHYDSFSFNVLDWLAGGGDGIRVRYVAYDDHAAMERVRAAGIPLVLSPGPKAPTDAAATWQLAEKSLGRVPILGVCLGHQILGALAGGCIIRARTPFHGSTRELRPLTERGLFHGISSPFRIATYNSLTLDPTGLAAHWQVTARCDRDDVQAIAYEPPTGAPAWGVQFHPESFMSENADALRRNWAEMIKAWYAARP